MKDHNCLPKKYAFTIDNQRFEIVNPAPTGRQILELAGRTPITKFLLVQSGHGQPREILPEDTVDLSCPGVERFRALPRECKEGFSGRREFRLPADDEVFLDSLELRWETVTVSNVMRLVIYDYPVPPGYNHETVDINLRIERSYPDTQIDMVYVYPGLSLSSGRGIGALANDSFDSKNWQRWSRHRQPGSAWQPGIDNVESHLALVNDWFNKEVRYGG
ncbi:MAG: multiubiquitin domain-containing protein [Candidatus Thiodiazotropha sp.]